MNKTIEKFVNNPKELFLLDGFGALLSAFLLGIVLVRFEAFFGMPRPILYFLAFLPCLFLLFDLYCYYQLKEKEGKYLKIIAVVNLVYCAISIACLFTHLDTLTVFGWIYFVLELLIVVAIAILELKVAKQLMARSGS